MKAYVINLDRDPERMAHMERQGKQFGIDWRRVPAADKLDEEIAARAAQARPGLLGFAMSAGAIDSADSHGTVFEDDDDPAPCIQGGLLGLDEKADYLKSSNDLNKRPRKAEYTFRKYATRKISRLAEKAVSYVRYLEDRVQVNRTKTHFLSDETSDSSRVRWPPS